MIVPSWSGRRRSGRQCGRRRTGAPAERRSTSGEHVTPHQRLVILVNLGTPREPTPEAVHPFLAEFLSDPAVVDFPSWLWKPILHGIILKNRPRRVAELYRRIWTPEGSPLEAETRRIAAGLASLVDVGTEVQWAYRYGQPSLASCLDAGARDQGAEIVVLPLYAQRTSSTTGTVIDEVRSLIRSQDLNDQLRVVHLEPDDRGYVDANAARFRQALQGGAWEPEHLLLSFHGIPARYDRREMEQYSKDCRCTADAITGTLGWKPERTTLCYQSKFGPERWLIPATADLLESLPGRGIHRVAVMTPGFLTEGLETIEEIGIQGREAFLAAGGTHFMRVPATGDHPAILESLARLAAGGPDRS